MWPFACGALAGTGIMLMLRGQHWSLVVVGAVVFVVGLLLLRRRLS